MSKVLGTTELANELAAKRGISKKEANDIMADVVEVLKSAIVDGGVSIKGVMTIKPKLRKGREGKCSFNGQTWKTEDKLVLSITTGNQMDAELNK